jgi:hypothetical protein
MKLVPGINDPLATLNLASQLRQMTSFVHSVHSQTGQHFGDCFKASKLVLAFVKQAQQF